jgi:hypothetical protein
LCWLLEGRPVVALTADTGRNQKPYRQHHDISPIQQTELRPLGDSLDVKSPRFGKQRGSQMKRIMGMLCFQNMDDAARAMDALEDAGYEFNIRHDAVDIYGAAVFVEAWRYVASDTDEWAAISAIHDELDHLVDPFTGLADDVGVFAEGELHDFYGTDDGTRANPQFRPGAVRWSPPVAGPEC